VAERIAVDAQALGRHAYRLGQVATDVRGVAAAANQAPLAPDAMGPVCSFLIGPVLAAAAAGQAAAASAATMVEWTGQRAQTWAAQATVTERDALKTLRGLDESVV